VTSVCVPRPARSYKKRNAVLGGGLLPWAPAEFFHEQSCSSSAAVHTRVRGRYGKRWEIGASLGVAAKR